MSLGTQDFQSCVQQAVRRIQPFPLVASVVEALRRSGIMAINFDLMYGLPYQTADSVATTAAQAVTLCPERFAVFGYAHVPWIKRHQNLLPVEALPAACDRYDQQQAIAGVLEDSGYEAIGLDHFSRPDDRLCIAAANGRLRCNFQGQTDDSASVLLGLGASAISMFPDVYVQNTAHVREWHKGLQLVASPLFVAFVCPTTICFEGTSSNKLCAILKRTSRRSLPATVRPRPPSLFPRSQSLLPMVWSVGMAAGSRLPRLEGRFYERSRRCSMPVPRRRRQRLAIVRGCEEGR